VPGLGADLAPAVSVGVSMASREGVFSADEALVCFTVHGHSLLEASRQRNTSVFNVLALGSSVDAVDSLPLIIPLYRSV